MLAVLAGHLEQMVAISTAVQAAAVITLRHRSIGHLPSISMTAAVTAWGKCHMQEVKHPQL